ncbi:MAG: hypothetical protein WC518_03360 [Patescibacteria group bacterium]
MDSNADLFFKHNDAIDKYVDMLGLPLDKVDNKNQTGHSNPEHIIKVLNYYKNLPQERKRPKLKIGTVVTRQNIDRLESIALLIKNFVIDYWKIYQFIPSGAVAKANQAYLQINEEEFLKAAGEILRSYGRDLKIIISPRRQRTNAYFLINPSGDVIMPQDRAGACDELNVGNIFDQDITTRWQSCVNEDKYLNNATDTFSYRWNSYPMPEIYNKIWRLSRKYNQKGQPYTEKHIEWLIGKSLSLTREEKMDEKIFIPFVLLHDVGYSATGRNNPFNRQSRKHHMMAGKQLAKKILRQVDYPADLSSKICNYIGIHDNWAFGDHQLYRRNKHLGLFNDLDFISMYSDACFGSMMKFLNSDSGQLLEYLKNNEKTVNRPFVCQASRRVLEESIKKIKIEYAPGL